MDASSGLDPKTVLDKALSEKMQKFNQHKFLIAQSKEKVIAIKLIKYPDSYVHSHE